jgi:hypothetical protein
VGARAAVVGLCGFWTVLVQPFAVPALALEKRVWDDVRVFQRVIHDCRELPSCCSFNFRVSGKVDSLENLTIMNIFPENSDFPDGTLPLIGNRNVEVLMPRDFFLLPRSNMEHATTCPDLGLPAVIGSVLPAIMNSKNAVQKPSWGLPEVLDVEFYLKKALVGDVRLDARNADVGAGLSLTYFTGNFVASASSSERSPDKEDTESAQEYADDGRASHKERPDGHGSLRNKVLFVSLIFAGFVACLGNAVRLVLRAKPDAGIAFWAVGCAGIMGLVTFGIPLIFDLF